MIVTVFGRHVCLQLQHLLQPLFKCGGANKYDTCGILQPEILSIIEGSHYITIIICAKQIKMQGS